MRNYFIRYEMQYQLGEDIVNRTRHHVNYNGRTYYQINEDPDLFNSLNGVIVLVGVVGVLSESFFSAGVAWITM